MTTSLGSDFQWLQFDLKVASHVARLSSHQLIAAAGLAPEAFDSSNPHFYRLFVPIWQAAERISGRAEIGAEVINHLKLDDFGSLGLAALTSADFFGAIDDLVSLSGTLTRMWSYELKKGQKCYQVCIRPTQADEHYSHHSVDATIAFGVFLSRILLASSPYSVFAINFRHSDFGRKASYESLFGCHCRFDQTVDSVEFAPESMCHPMPMRNTQLHSLLRSQLEQELEEADSVQRKVVLAIREALAEQRWPNRFDIAMRIGLSERTMLRQLKLADMTFRELQEKLLEKEAVQLIESGFSAEAAAEKLGYSGSSPLARMLKRRLGKSISQLR